MRLTKIYTKIGDKGETRLASGEKISKANQRINSYGTVDELNAVCGMLADSLKEKEPKLFADLEKRIHTIQNLLFDIGGELSFSEGKCPDYVQQIKSKHVTMLEEDMDKYNELLEPLKNFILPGGHPSQSLCHLARVTCRRAEREVVDLAKEESVPSEVIVFLNRLSDWFFVLCRYINKHTKTPEKLWEQTKN